MSSSLSDFSTPLRLNINFQILSFSLLPMKFPAHVNDNYYATETESGVHQRRRFRTLWLPLVSRTLLATVLQEHVRCRPDWVPEVG